MQQPKNDLLRLVERMTPEDCIELSEILQMLSDVPRDAKWKEMFSELRQAQDAMW